MVDRNPRRRYSLTHKRPKEALKPQQPLITNSLGPSPIEPFPTWMGTKISASGITAITATITVQRHLRATSLTLGACSDLVSFPGESNPYHRLREAGRNPPVLRGCYHARTTREPPFLGGEGSHELRHVSMQTPGLLIFHSLRPHHANGEPRLTQTGLMGQ